MKAHVKIMKTKKGPRVRLMCQPTMLTPKDARALATALNLAAEGAEGLE